VPSDPRGTTPHDVRVIMSRWSDDTSKRQIVATLEGIFSVVHGLSAQMETKKRVAEIFYGKTV
jgi:hypothetical protein